MRRRFSKESGWPLLNQGGNFSVRFKEIVKNLIKRHSQRRSPPLTPSKVNINKFRLLVSEKELRTWRGLNRHVRGSLSEDLEKLYGSNQKLPKGCKTMFYKKIDFQIFIGCFSDNMFKNIRSIFIIIIILQYRLFRWLFEMIVSKNKTLIRVTATDLFEVGSW